MLAIELNDRQATWKFHRADGAEFTIIRVIRFDDRVKLVLNRDGDVSTHTLEMSDHVDVRPPAPLDTPASIADDMPAPATTPAPDLLAGLSFGEQNIIASALEMLHRDALRQATQYGLEDTIKYYVDPREVSTLIEKLRTDARARHDARHAAA